METPFKFVRRTAVRAARNLLASIPFETALLISRELLAAQGFGCGADITTSGEVGIFNLVKAPSPLLFDCGGHVGDYTALWLRKFPDGRAFVFEPAASHYSLLESRFSGNSSIRLFPNGLGAEDARLPLYKNRDVTGLASLSRRRLDHHGIVMDQSETVEIRKLDDMIAELDVSVIDLLKVDVEGHELSVLQGAAKAIETGIIKLIQIEFGGCNLDTHTNLQDFFYFFKDRGLVMGLVQPRGRIIVLDRYREFYEQYLTTNFVAGPRLALTT
ncbi:FkbM family methyltransferase [Methylocystis sp. H4A]|uniref:FkbM family methyltransferase n=1 Tax=Methylocystis sp. H4A TaxID=2785788 RepID=UPI0018C26371|nr:FkbM family methyltransferase [Methylocystis sp. H4A]MBG0799978.1 FkbM family methyltransferase [Methylocystis sp. H4A]